MLTLFERASQRFARFVTNAVVACPAAWHVLRPLFRRQWDWLAPRWEQRRRHDTPIYVPPERLRAELERRGFSDFAYFAPGRGTALVARRR